MLGRSEMLLMYYLGFGFVILLGWVIAQPFRPLGPEAARRYLRWTALAAVLGLLHPAIALAAKDIAGLIGVELPDDELLQGTHARSTAIANVMVAVSFVPVVAVVALTLA